MIRNLVAALALSTAIAGTAHALTWETQDKGASSGQAQVADPDDKLQQQMGVTEGPSGMRTYKFQGSGFSFGVVGPQGAQENPPGQLRFGPSTPSDQRPNSSRLNSIFGPSWP